MQVEWLAVVRWGVALRALLQCCSCLFDEVLREWTVFGVGCEEFVEGCVGVWILLDVLLTTI